MTDYDIYDLFAHHGYHARALKRLRRKIIYLEDNEAWFDSVDPNAATVLRGLGHQFEVGGTEALETPALWEVPGNQRRRLDSTLRAIGAPVAVMKEAKTRLFASMKFILRPLSELCSRNIEQRHPKDNAEAEFSYIDIGSVNNRTKQIVSPRKLKA